MIEESTRQASEIVKTQKLKAQLFEAATQGDIGSLQALLQAGLDINAKCREGRTALWWAAKTGQTEIIKTLIRHGAEPDLRNVGVEAILVALLGAHFDTLKFLLSVEAVRTGTDGPLLLCRAIFYGSDVAAVKWLLSHGVVLEREPKPARDPLLIAASNGKVEIVRLLIKYGAKIDLPHEHGAALFWASKKGHISVVGLLLERGVDVNRVSRIPHGSKRTALTEASNGGHLDVVKLLLRHGADINWPNPENDSPGPLYTASSRGHTDVVRLLIKSGAEVNGGDLDSRRNFRPLTAAVQSNHANIARLLLENGASPNANTFNALLYHATWNGSSEIVELLLEYGADPNYLGQTGWTPLWLASRGGHTEVVRLLLDNGADPNQSTMNSESLFRASERGHILIVKLLLERGADKSRASRMRSPPRKLWTPREIASREGHTRIVELLDAWPETSPTQ